MNDSSKKLNTDSHQLIKECLASISKALMKQLFVLAFKFTVCLLEQASIEDKFFTSQHL